MHSRIDMWIRTIAAALFVVGACADSEEPVEPAPVVDGEILSVELCELPLETEGPCALACDQDRLFETYIPESYCVTFNCTHVDGRPYPLGGCNF
jgi:hypothetical protein